MACRQLFPMLPPELRNLIYSYTISDNPATNLGLPFPHKIYNTRPSTVTIIPVHHGYPALLALRKYNVLEADEYASWLLDYAVQIWIGVAFRGDLNTFVQEHWDKKMAAHLHKLAKNHSWVKGVRRYEVNVVWETMQGIIDPIRKKKKKDLTVGGVASRMIEVLTSMMDGEFRRKKGCVKAGLFIQERLLNQPIVPIRPSIIRFSAQDLECAEMRREVMVQTDLKPEVHGWLPPWFKPIEKSETSRVILVEQGGFVSWQPWMNKCERFQEA